MNRPVLAFLICCLVAMPVSAADRVWEWVTPLPQGHSLSAAAIGDGVTVAVGGAGTVITRADGGEWMMTHSGAGYSLSDVVWANGLFVAVGGAVGFEFSPGLGVVLTSEDGIAWVERRRGNSLSLEAVAWTGSRFVAVGIGHEVLISPDGLSWSEQQVASDAVTMTDVAWNGVNLVAVGYDNVIWAGTPSFFTSDDGDDWQVTNFECDHCEPRSIAAVDGRFVAVGSWRKALVSDDGLTWNEAPHDTPSDLDLVVGAGDRFLVIGHDVVGTSSDGYTWSIDELVTESSVYGLAWGGDGFLAVGADGFMMSSLDGSAWNRLSETAFDISGTREINELATDGSTIVGVGEGGIIVTGRHGAEWARRYSSVEGELNGIVWTGTAFWAAGDSGVVKSTDGVHWSQMLQDAGVTLFDLGWNGSLFVAVGRRVVATSPDGHEWTDMSLDIAGQLFTVGWTGSRWVAAGNGEWFYTSIDGTTWQPQALDEGITLNDMAWNGDRLVAVGYRYDVGGVVLTTEDGISWAEGALPEIPTSGYDDVTWTGTRFVAVSRSTGDFIFSSEDGFSWKVETTGTGVWPVSVVGDNRSLFATGRGLKIIRRTEPLQGSAEPRRPTGRVAPGVDAKRMGQHLLTIESP